MTNILELLYKSFIRHILAPLYLSLLLAHIK